MEAPDDPYAILGVHRAASTNEVRKARNRLLLHWHPDHSADPQAAEHAARINAAYEVLSDPARRAAYDRGVSAGSLASILRPKPPTGWAPAAPDAD
ncbi:MAG: J domain-containing protein, partial [Candidatus Dormibacteraeota bacterium]|nr:J domain-containing protein [Candidatus Dormibacteraeota bacterium]